MAATAEQIARLRRMVNEPVSFPAASAVYTDDVLKGYIERYPLTDERGHKPFWWNVATTPPAQEDNVVWIPTYDLNAAAADVWEEKAGTFVECIDISTDGQTLKRSQRYDHCMAQCRHYRSKRMPTTFHQTMWPRRRRDRPTWIGNLPEVDETE